MIISRTPFRVSFAGGGTDLPQFYQQHGHGEVVSVAIQKYIYIVIHPYFHDKIRIKYSKTEDVNSADEIKHPIVRECLKQVGVTTGIEIASFADVSSGTGLGSSSSFTVGLLHALYAYQGAEVSQKRLAEEACDIEINQLGEPIGKQDQYAAAYGGLNHFKFNKDESVEVKKLSIDESLQEKMQQQLLLYYIGGERSASELLQKQGENISKKDASEYEQQLKIMQQVQPTKQALLDGNLQQLGINLNDIWNSKKQLSNAVSNPMIDELYSKALSAGASGGKLLGAGGGGFLLFQHQNHSKLTEQLNLRTLEFKIDLEGSTILLDELGIN